VHSAAHLSNIPIPTIHGRLLDLQFIHFIDFRRSLPAESPSLPCHLAMSVATILQPASRASRASTSSSSSYQLPVSRQNTMSSASLDSRAVRQSKRMSVTALYLSMSAKDKDLEIDDDLAKGASSLLLLTT
jgi:hypothetical protein